MDRGSKAAKDRMQMKKSNNQGKKDNKKQNTVNVFKTDATFGKVLTITIQTNKTKHEDLGQFGTRKTSAAFPTSKIGPIKT